jgi:Leucine-rich repeat (LRR) protein
VGNRPAADADLEATVRRKRLTLTMENPMEDWVIEEIRRAKREHSSFLDLGNADLEALPDELFELMELRSLSLGVSYFDAKSGRRAQHLPWRLSQRNRLQTLPKQIARLVRLVELHLEENAFSSAESLAQLTNLTSLDLRGTLITSAEPLVQLTNLTWLSLGKTPITSADPLARLANLTSLDLGDTRITSAEPLAQLTNLIWLDLSKTSITSAEPLARLNNLTSLDLRDTPIMSAEPLAQLTNLASLDLGGTRITSAEPLAGLAKLTNLFLNDTREGRKPRRKHRRRGGRRCRSTEGSNCGRDLCPNRGRFSCRSQLAGNRARTAPAIRRPARS